MKIILTCGHSHSGHEFVHQTLVAAGLSQAQPSRRESMAPAELHENIFKAHDFALSDGSAASQLKPGKVWEELAVDLFLGNLAQRDWGWADARAVWLLEFWKSFDPQIRFTLVYSAPEFAVGQMLREKAVTTASIDQALASWVSANTEILRFYNRNRDRCVLVNVAAALHAPTRLIEKSVTSFGLGIGQLAAEYQIDRSGIPAIASSLARELIVDRNDVMSLFQELESSADLHGEVVAVRKAEKVQASQEYLDLLENIEQMCHEAREHGDQLSRLRQERNELETKLLQAKKEADDHAAMLKQAQETPSVPHAELMQMQSKVNELTQENELLLIQLHQVQEELESYFLQYQQLAGKGHQVASEFSLRSKPWFEYQPAEITFDLRREFDGDNWYHAEGDGRWAGPEEVSSFRIPALRTGRYELQLDVVDAMEPEIFTGMEVSLNGTRIEAITDWQGYPTLFNAKFVTDELAESPTWEFQFKFPKLVSPAQHGSDDQRYLAIRIRSLVLRALD
jgi:hypothetical protein